MVECCQWCQWLDFFETLNSWACFRFSLMYFKFSSDLFSVVTWCYMLICYLSIIQERLCGSEHSERCDMDATSLRSKAVEPGKSLISTDSPETKDTGTSVYSAPPGAMAQLWPGRAECNFKPTSHRNARSWWQNIDHAMRWQHRWTLFTAVKQLLRLHESLANADVGLVALHLGTIPGPKQFQSTFGLALQSGTLEPSLRKV